MRIRVLTIGLLLAGVLVAGVASSGADNRGATIKHLRAQVKQLTQQRNTARAGREVALDKLADAKTAAADAKTAMLAAQTTSAAQTVELVGVKSARDVALLQVAALTPQLAAAQAALGTGAQGEAAAMNPDQLWALIGVIFAHMPDQGLCGYSPSYYNSGTYTSYSFTRFVC